MKKGKYKLILYSFDDKSGQLVALEEIDFQMQPMRLVKQHKPQVFGNKGVNVQKMTQESFKEMLIKLFRRDVSLIGSFEKIDTNVKRAKRLDKQLNKMRNKGLFQRYSFDNSELMLWSMTPTLSDDDLREIAIQIFMEEI